MKKKIFLAIVLISTILGAQNQKATLYFRDGTSATGLARIIGANVKIKFRKNKNSKKIFYSYKKVDKILIRENDEDVMYQFKIIQNKKTPLLLEILKEGKVTLYRNVRWNSFGGAPTWNATGTMYFTKGYTYPISNYYVSRDNKDVVFHLGAKGSLFTKNFKKAASEYFKDCKALVNKIQKKEFRKKDIIEIVGFYNTNCQ